uniref:Purinergic receptor n=1 Tax=Lotharella oceanica TaxID=641309 RepID=A0A7S2TPR3_9EUKA|mmetsp:Transcript_24299/g.45470  ORF Transcript_24299/g.45470 Transcript_24299/m.45470 type:complete len:242 (+) Transcript_24299:7-732(+)
MIREDQKNLLYGIRNFSVFIRLNVQFPAFGITLTTGKTPSPGLSLFLISDMISNACNGQACDFEDIRQRGAVLLAKAEYNCDEDTNEKDCYPDWEFSRIDEGDGFNFRTVQYTDDSGKERILRKMYGIRVVVKIYGQAGKFNIVNLLVALGAGLGLLSVASITADFLLQNCWPKREKFLHDKFCTVDLETMNQSNMSLNNPGESPYPESKLEYNLMRKESNRDMAGEVPNPLLLAAHDDDE